MSLEATIAANRFGLGAAPGQINTIARNPKAWLLGQTEVPGAALVRANGLPTSAEGFRTYQAYAQMRREERRAKQSPMAAANPQPPVQGLGFLARSIGQDIEARIGHALATEAPFLERWVLFWSNRLTMAAKNPQTAQFPGPYEREAIRPHVLGKFSQLLKSCALHVGMLIYLDQVRSIGPNAPAASTQRGRARELGLNENLAREILELHTLGPDGGYTQADVTEFARALTGWTVTGPRTVGARNAGLTANQELGSVMFAAAMHEPGPRTILGKTFSQNGREQALEILDWLARQPQTARRTALAVATHFVSDTPPPALVTRLERVFIATDGDLRALAGALIESPEAWVPGQGKFKSPNEFLISTLRASATKTVSANALRTTFEQLGQAPWRAPSPKGWPDTASFWAAPDAILKRVDWSNLAADVIGQTMAPMAFAESALGASLTAPTRTAISRAQDSRQGIVIALMSPEFQRR
jgi:uncharacterized protein (DUF1800 family)